MSQAQIVLDENRALDMSHTKVGLDVDMMALYTNHTHPATMECWPFQGVGWMNGAFNKRI